VTPGWTQVPRGAPSWSARIRDGGNHSAGDIMSSGTDNPAPHPEPRADRLDSWKEIASYLGRSVSTVQRWEHEEGLPVHRHVHGKLGSVYASKAEIDAWWETRRLALDAPTETAAPGPVHDAQATTSRGPRGPTEARRLPPIAVLILITTTAIAAALVAWLRPAPHPSPAAITSIAVLPLRDLGAAPGDEWFAEGVADALRVALSRRGTLRVTASTSSNLYADSTERPREICRSLGVDAVVEGTVQRAGDRVRVNVALVDGRSEQRLRTVSVEHDLANVFQLYEDLSRQVVEHLAVDGEPRPPARAERARVAVPEAYEAYLRGLYFRKRRQMGGCAQAEPHLQKALALDPRLAEAHASLAFCYGFDRLSGQLSASEAARRGRREAEQALALDDRQPMAHVALGLVHHRLEYDWAGAERHLRRAVEIDPNHVFALGFLSELLYAGGRPDEGLALLQRALAIDPLSLDHHAGLGFALYNLRRFQAAADHLRDTLELDPDWRLARLWLAESLAALGRRDETVAEYLEFIRRVMPPAAGVAAVAALDRAHREQGWAGFWHAELALVHGAGTDGRSEWLSRGMAFPYFMARRYARLSDRERALDALEAAHAARDMLLVFMGLETLFVPLHDEPRFRALAGRTGIAIAAAR
jgi:TolB-like protein/Tfp pilus assembly protein PilF/predicted DNA-binding transcriptional regulator AlpA